MRVVYLLSPGRKAYFNKSFNNNMRANSCSYGEKTHRLGFKQPCCHVVSWQREVGTPEGFQTCLWLPKSLVYQQKRSRGDTGISSPAGNMLVQILKVKNKCVFCRLDTMEKTWGTAPSARGSSWCCGWKEWSSQWPLSTWGSKQPSCRTNTSWASGRRDFYTELH